MDQAQLQPAANETVEQELARLRKIERQFRLIVDQSKDYGIVLIDADNRIAGWNAGGERLFGYTEGEIVGRSAEVFFTPEDIAKGEAIKEIRTAAEEGRAEDDRWHVRKDGSRFWGSGVTQAIRDEAGNLQGFIKILRDLTLQKRAQEALHASEESLRLFLESVTDYALIQVDADAKITQWNIGAERLTQYSEDDALGRSIQILSSPSDVDAKYFTRELQRTLDAGKTEAARWLVRKDGSRFWARWVTTPIRDTEGGLRGFAKVMRDETERRLSEERIRASLLEKDALLKEVHHRVKNNLQVIVSLLSMQAGRILDPNVLVMFEEAQNRVRAIASIHERLYSSSDLASIDFGAYLRTLAQDLFVFYGVDPARIDLSFDADDLVLDITQAIPLGLIVNELLTNCLKHAFPSGQSGSVHVALRYAPRDGRSLDESDCELMVRDNGEGLPAGFERMDVKSMGLHLVNVLTRQLHGEMSATTVGKGTCVRVVFPLAPPTDSSD